MSLVAPDQVEKSKVGRKKGERVYVPVKIDRDILTEARYVADVRGVSLAEFLSEILRAPVKREFEKEMTRRMGGGKP